MYCFHQAGSGLVGEDDALGSGGSVAARIESSYMISLRDLDMRHIKDFTFVHGECRKYRYLSFRAIKKSWPFYCC